MELFALQVKPNSDKAFEHFFNKLSKQFSKITENSPMLDFYKHNNEYLLEGSLPNVEYASNIEDIFNIFCNDLAEYIILNEENRLLTDIITKVYFYNDDELQSILGHSQDNEVKKNHKSKKKILVNLLKEYFNDNVNLNLQGFLKFRASDYKNSLEEIVEYCIDEYQMEKQYEEFISLLQYFVFIQNKKTPLVHIIESQSNKFEVYDIEENIVSQKKWDIEIEHEIPGMSEVNNMDLIISTLIELSPEKVIIHSKKKNNELLLTVKAIYDEDADFCDHCSVCQTLVSKNV